MSAFAPLAVLLATGRVFESATHAAGGVAVAVRVALKRTRAVRRVVLPIVLLWSAPCR